MPVAHAANFAVRDIAYGVGEVVHQGLGYLAFDFVNFAVLDVNFEFVAALGQQIN